MFKQTTYRGSVLEGESLVQEVWFSCPVSWLLNYSGQQQSRAKAMKSASNSAPLTHQLYNETANKLSIKASKIVLFCTRRYVIQCPFAQTPHKYVV
jgi:hypothetical protein